MLYFDRSKLQLEEDVERLITIVNRLRRSGGQPTPQDVVFIESLERARNARRDCRDNTTRDPIFS